VLQRIRQLHEIRKDDKGFTLIELLITVVILGVLAGIVVFSVSQFNDDGVAAACKADIKNVETATEAYYAKNDHDYADTMAILVSSGYLREAPTNTNGYTISYNRVAGPPETVTVTGTIAGAAC